MTKRDKKISKRDLNDTKISLENEEILGIKEKSLSVEKSNENENQQENFNSNEESENTDETLFNNEEIENSKEKIESQVLENQNEESDNFENSNKGTQAMSETGNIANDEKKKQEIDFQIVNENDENVDNGVEITEKVQNKSFSEKIRIFFKSDYLISSAIIVFLLMVTLAINGDKPFGENSFLISDSYAQVAAFFNHIFDFFEGKSTLFYSNSFGGGTEIFSTLQYMYLNPFYLIVLLGGRDNIVLMMTFSVILMFIFNGCIFIWFSRKHFPAISKFWRIILSLFFVFSGYVNFNISFITWIIYPALSLIVLDRFINFIKTGKIASFIICLSWYVISCFSVGISTAIILFVLMVGYVFIMIEKPLRKKYLTGLFVVFLSSALISIIILFPSIMAMLNSNRTSSFLSNLFGNADNEIRDKITILFFDFFIEILCIYYIVKCNKKDKLNKFLLFSTIILFLPLFFDSVMKIICFSKYQGFANRFYFLNETLMFYVAMLCLDKYKLKLNDCTSEFISKLLIGVLTGLILVVSLFIYTVDYSQLGVITKSPILSITNAGLIVLGANFILLLIYIITAYFGNIRKILGKKLFKFAVVLIMVLSFSLNFLTFTSSFYKNDEIINETNSLISSSGISGKIKYFKSECYDQHYNSYLGDVKSLSIFTSLISSNTLLSYSSLGYATDSTVATMMSGTLLSDCILGLKYYVTINEQDRPYLVEVARSENVYIYENILATTGAFSLDIDFEFDDELTILENVKKLQEYFGINGELYSDGDANITKTLITEDDEKKLKIEFTATEGGILYLNKYISLIETSTDDTEDVYEIQWSNNYSDVTYLKAGESYSFLINWSDEYDIDEVGAIFINYDVASSICQKIQENQVSFEFTKNGFVVNGTLSENQRLYIMIPEINGLEFTLNGESIEVENVFSSMISLTSNETEISLIAEYHYPYLTLWAVVFLLLGFLLAGVLVLYNKTKLKFVEGVIGYAMNVLAYTILFVVYFLGIVFSIIWFFI